MRKSEYFIERENRILKQLLLDGFFYMNYSTQDCDGCCSDGVNKFTSLDDFYEYEEGTYESAEGSVSISLARRYPDGTFDLNEPYNGGQWGN